MFVINANASGSASATAYATGSGGNTSQTSASGYYDIPMNGSTYNMFESHAYCAVCYNLQSGCYIGRNGNNENEESVISYGKARQFDQDVLFPNNEICCNTGEHPFNDGLFFCGAKDFGEHNLDEIVEMDFGETPAINYTTTISRKKFDGGEKVGRVINTYMGLKLTNTRFIPTYQCPENGAEGTGITHAAHKCPITYYIDMGLMHTDGTKTSIQKKEIIFPYYKLESDLSCTKLGGDENLMDGSGCYSCQMFNGETINTPVTACPGDRLYVEKGMCPICWLYDVHTTTKTSTSAQKYGSFGCCCTRSFCTFGNTYTHCFDPIATNICHTKKEQRFNGIQFSIE